MFSEEFSDYFETKTIVNVKILKYIDENMLNKMV
jgi:hypothetical protein